MGVVTSGPLREAEPAGLGLQIVVELDPPLELDALLEEDALPELDEPEPPGAEVDEPPA